MIFSVGVGVLLQIQFGQIEGERGGVNVTLGLILDDRQILFGVDIRGLCVLTLIS